jgi:hypothetical protein
MNAPNIAVTNLPSSSGAGGSPKPSTPPTAPSSPTPPTPPAAPIKEGSGSGAVFKIGLVVAAIVAIFFIYRTIALGSQLKQSRTESAQLQAQVDKARADATKAEATARGLSEDMAKLQSQLELAKGETAAAKATADKATSRAAGLQGQFEQAKRETAEARASADKASAELAKLQAQLQAQQAAAKSPAAMVEPVSVKAPLANAKPMPVNVSFRKAEVGDGKAVVLQNTSNKSLNVTVKFSDPAATRSKEYHLAMDAGGTKELGWLGAWILASGDRIDIESTGFNSIIKTAP